VIYIKIWITKIPKFWIEKDTVKGQKSIKGKRVMGNKGTGGVAHP